MVAPNTGLNLNPSQFVSSNQSFSSLVKQVGNDNGLGNLHNVKIGQTITLPDGSTATVQKGDTLSGIVDRWKKTTEQAKEPSPQPTKEDPPPAPAKEEDPPPPSNNPEVNDENATANEPATPESIPVSKPSSDSGSKMPPIRPNPLSKYSSYTYNISLYMINPDTFNLYSEGGHTVPKDWKLICRSGGINSSDEYGKSSRAEGFDLDVFIDNLTIKTAISSKETYSACNSFDFSFQIFEPYGFSFPTKLIKAAHKVQAKSKIQRKVNESITALQTSYLLAIRFYGYDENGNLMKDQENTSDPSATYERNFPIVISGFDFKLDPKMVIYNVKAKLINEQISLGKSKLEIPEDMTVKGETVKDVLEGSGEDNKNSNVIGLIQRLNEIQQQLLDEEKIEVKDVYKIKFEPNTGIEKGILVDVENNPIEKSTNTNVQNADNVNPKTESQPAVISKRTRPISITKGSTILQSIDQIISQSSYVTNALKITTSEKYTKVKETEEDYDENTASTIGWYNVVPSAKLLDFDKKRNMFASEITYIIKRYEVPYIRGLRLGKRTPYYGPVKRYKHWYMSNDLTTNTHEKEIINYDVNYNLLYFNIAGYGTEAPLDQTDDNAPVANLGSGSNPTGKAAGWFDKAVGPFKTFLYSPADQIKAKIVILGDPDYLMTSTTKGYEEAITKYFGTDQSINPNSGQVFIEIDFRDAKDYNDDDSKKSAGLMDISKDGDILFWDYPDNIKKNVQGVIYMVWQVTSTFNRGVFTQELKTCVPPFVSDAKKKNKESERVGAFDTGGFENMDGFGGALDVAGFSDIGGLTDITSTALNNLDVVNDLENGMTSSLNTLTDEEIGNKFASNTLLPDKPESTFSIADDNRTYAINDSYLNEGGREA